MAVGTLRGRLLVDNNWLVSNQAGLDMTLVAGYVGMPTRKREVCALVMIKSRRHPALRIVTIRAGRFSSFLELAVMDILVTIRTDL